MSRFLFGQKKMALGKIFYKKRDKKEGFLLKVLLGCILIIQLVRKRVKVY